jgi:hypothetical protein
MTPHPLAQQLAALTPETTSPTTRRALTRRARALGRCDLLPAWIAESPAGVTLTVSLDAICHEVDAILIAKIAARTTPTPQLLQVLRLVYLRGLHHAPQHTPIPPQQHAQARVNTFLAYLDGDPNASAQDADLVDPQTLALLR